MPSRNIKEILKYLGSTYTIRMIDGEDCIYRKINDAFDIEVSRANRKNNLMWVYVWDISEKIWSCPHIIETIRDINGEENLKAVLEALVKKYQDLTELPSKLSSNHPDSDAFPQSKSQTCSDFLSSQ